MKLIELDNAISIPLSNEEHEVFFKYVNTNIKENKDIDEREKLLLQKLVWSILMHCPINLTVSKRVL